MKRNYIVYDIRNSMWNDGHIEVYKNKRLVEWIEVDDNVESVDDLIEELKEKYSIKKVIYKEYNWR